MRSMAWVWLSIVWVASCCVIGYAVYATKNANCLWALLIPASMGFTTGKGSESK